MASSSTAAIIFTTAILLTAIINTIAVREGELTVMFGVLRARGYHLFANAITTSDLHYDLNSDGNFTLLAPINSALFALDMTMPATNYVTTLRYHVIPRRMSMVDLLSLPPPSNTVPTLVPGMDVRIEQRRSVRSLITVGGVDIVVPGMFYGTNVAVHGLGGILEYRHHTRHQQANGTGSGSGGSNRTTTSSPPVYNITGNYTFEFPVAIESPFSSHRAENQTGSLPDPSPMASGTDKHVNMVYPASSVLTKEELKPRRLKLLEMSSGGTEWTGMDDETIDCLMANDDVGEEMNIGIHPRRLSVPSNMICAQKLGQI